MNFALNFETVVNYDPGSAGISIDVELRLGDMSGLFAAKVDTGSTHCIFARECAEHLSIDIETGDERIVHTVRGSFITYGHTVTLIAAGFMFDSVVFFAVDESVNRNVLGRHGWLDRVVIGLNDYEGKLYVSGYDPNPI